MKPLRVKFTVYVDDNDTPGEMADLIVDALEFYQTIDFDNLSVEEVYINESEIARPRIGQILRNAAKSLGRQR